jgi:hypothetical protein
MRTFNPAPGKIALYLNGILLACSILRHCALTHQQVEQCPVSGAMAGMLAEDIDPHQS